MKVYEAMAKAFADEGTTAVFGMMGSQNIHFVNALARLNVPTYEVRHEGPGLAMAEGWQLVNGEVGVCTTTSGPAVTQLATTMVVAARARTPLVAFCGDEKTDGSGTQGHELDQAKFAAGIECEFVRVTTAETACAAVQEAFYLARSKSCPVMLSVPVNFQMQEHDASEEYVPSATLISTTPVYPNPEILERAVEIISKVKHPVIIVGRGAMASGAEDVVLRLARRIGAVIATTLMAMNWPPEPDDFHLGIAGLFSTRTAMELFQDADCVIAAGASLTMHTTVHGLLFSDVPIVQFDPKPQVVMGSGRLADCYVQSDARVGLELVDDLLNQRSVEQTGFRTDEVKKRIEAGDVDPDTFEMEPGTVDHREICALIDELVPAEVGLVIGGGQSTNPAVMMCRAKRPYTVINKYFGGMSKGLAGVIGACVASGKAPAMLIEGEAGFMMHLAEFETAIRYELPIMAIILNNQAFGHEFQSSTKSPALDPQLARISTPDLGQVGIALGGRGYLVRTIDEFRVATKDFVANPGPMIIDVRTSPYIESVQARRVHGHENV